MVLLWCRLCFSEAVRSARHAFIRPQTKGVCGQEPIGQAKPAGYVSPAGAALASCPDAVARHRAVPVRGVTLSVCGVYAAEA